MRRLFNLSLSGLLIFALYSCEKVVELDLDETPPQIVVEANLDKEQEELTVSISRSNFYYSTDAYEQVEGASLILETPNGDFVDVNDLGDGAYEAAVLEPSEGVYTLRAEIDGVQYEARSELRDVIHIVELVTEFTEETTFTDEGYFVYTRFIDPAGEANFYRFIHSIDGVVERDGDDLQVIDDDLFDGNFARVPLFQKVFDQGTTVSVDLVHFDAASYDYFNSLSDIISGGGGPGGGTAAPANPNTNWSGGILGYFSARSTSTASVFIE